MLAADADDAVSALRKRPKADPNRIGVPGTSQADWVIPPAVVRSQHRIAFVALAPGPAVTTDEQGQWSQLAGENAANPPPLTATKRAEITRELHPGASTRCPCPHG